MFTSIYTKGQAEQLKNSHGVGKPLPDSGALVIVRPKHFGGGLIRLAPTRKRRSNGNPYYRIDVMTEAELQEALKKDEVA